MFYIAGLIYSGLRFKPDIILAMLQIVPHLYPD